MTRRTFLLALMPGGEPVFSATFLQLTQQHRSWTAERWTGLFQDFSALGLDQLIVQWTEGYVDLLPLLFHHAAAASINVELGLINEPRFWRETPQILDELKERADKLARALKPFAKRSQFSGWYITEEVDDTRWRDQHDYKRLVRYLKSVRKKLRGSPVAISAFSNGAQPPADFARFAGRLMRDTKIDRLLFQDSIGARKLSLDALPNYYAALRATLQGRAEAVVEIFDQTSENPFEARPASLDRIRRQVEIARTAGFGRPVVFSVPEYRTPELITEFGRRGSPLTSSNS